MTAQGKAMRVPRAFAAALGAEHDRISTALKGRNARTNEFLIEPRGAEYLPAIVARRDLALSGLHTRVVACTQGFAPGLSYFGLSGLAESLMRFRRPLAVRRRAIESARPDSRGL